MTAIETPQAPAPEMMRRRVDDLPLPSRPLEWDDEGTPLEGVNVVYLYRPRAERFPRWAEIRTQEHLLDIQAEPERFELRTLFTVCVDDLARHPLTLIAAARVKLDRLEAAQGAAIASFRAAMAEIASQP